MKYIREYRKYFVSLLQLILFIPFFRQGLIGSDWDSYGSYASSLIIQNQNIYLPSRPPGFPLFEYLVSFFINYEVRIILFVIFFFLVGINFVTDKLFSEKYINDFLYFALLTSPILLISSFSIMDYVVGLFFSLCGLYVLKEEMKSDYLFLFFMILAAATRLSNILFFLVGLYIIKKDGSSNGKITLLTSAYVLSIILIYFPAYNLAGGLCFLNLTNTDHELFQRLGRFGYKQTYLVGLPGLTMLVYIIFSIRKKVQFSDFYLPYILIFLLFEISFLRLPTEEGHMLPALFMFFLLLSQVNISNNLQLYLFIAIFISNFVYLELITVDVPNHVENFTFTPRLEEGLLLQDYQERGVKGVDANYHIDNAVIQVVDSWKDGGPNC